MAALDQRDLVKCVRKFRNIDDELRKVNTRASKLREDKKFIENEMSDILRRSVFEGINKLEIQDDGSYIKIQRPETWNKSWSMGTRELQTFLDDYFRSHATYTSTSCYNFIVAAKKRELIANEFSFRRIMPSEDKDETRSTMASSNNAQ